jgi:hypothetical protein
MDDVCRYNTAGSKTRDNILITEIRSREVAFLHHFPKLQLKPNDLEGTDDA